MKFGCLCVWENVILQLKRVECLILTVSVTDGVCLSLRYVNECNAIIMQHVSLLVNVR